MICTAHNLLKLFTLATATRAGEPASNAHRNPYLGRTPRLPDISALLRSEK